MHAIKHAIDKANIDPSEVEDVIMGCGTPEGATGVNIARQSAIRAGLPVSTAGVTVNRFCSSGMQTIAMAIAIVCIPDEQNLFTVTPAVETGRPALMADCLAMLTPVAPSGVPHPIITSSTSDGSIFALSIACFIACTQ